MTNTTLLLGATGETGKELLKQLAASQTITKVGSAEAVSSITNYANCFSRSYLSCITNYN